MMMDGTVQCMAVMNAPIYMQIVKLRHVDITPEDSKQMQQALLLYYRACHTDTAMNVP